jgi:hypothetical protein
MKKIVLILFLIQFSVVHAQTLPDSLSVKKHLQNIIGTPTYRNYLNTASLNMLAGYIKEEFLKHSSEVTEQIFHIDGREYRNVICSFDTMNTERLIIGAHYDVFANQDGADDNASGVVGLLELAKLLKGKKFKYRIDLVAYTLEEPVYYKTENMGSYVHAKYLYDNKIKVKGMISLEMLGYFSHKKNSQKYPLKILKAFYGNRGDFITVVQKFGNGSFPNKFKRKMKHHATIKTKSFKAPASLPGIGWSDHLNYWKFGFSALMITDTSFFRNPNYHLPSDTIETLDLQSLCKVIESVYFALMQI